MLHFGDGVVYVAHGENAHADQSVGSDGTVLLRQPSVVPPEDGVVGIVVANVAPPARGGALEQDLCVYSVLVLLPDSLLGRAGPRRVFIALAEGGPTVVVRLHALTGVEIERHLGCVFPF